MFHRGHALAIRSAASIFLFLCLPSYGQSQHRLSPQDKLRQVQYDARLKYEADEINMKRLSLAVTRYSIDHQRLPSLKTAAQFRHDLLPYAHDPRVFVSPVTGRPYHLVASLSNEPLSKFHHPESAVLYEDSPRPSVGGNWILRAYVDGHIKSFRTPVGKGL